MAHAAPAQLTEAARDDLLGTGIELPTVIAGLGKPPAPKSLTAQTPAWLRIVLRQSFADESAPAVLEQMARLLNALRSAPQRTGHDASTISGAVIARVAALEGEWLGAAPESLRLDDLLVLERTYAALGLFDEPLRLVSSTVPWEPLLAMVLARKYRLGKPRLQELFTYVKQLPSMARRLQVRTAEAILRRSEDPEQIAEILAHLSGIYEFGGKLEAATMMYRESMRLRKVIEGGQWIGLADLYARALDTSRARRALAVAGEQLNDSDLQPTQRTAATTRIARVRARIELANRRRALGPQPTADQRIEALELDRRLGRIEEASRWAQELDKASVQDARVYTNLGLLCIRGGLRAKALTCYKMAEQLPNHDASRHELGGWLMIQPLIEELVLLSQDRGDLDRTLQRCKILRGHVDALLAQPGYEELRTASVLLGLVDDLAPALRAKDAGQALQILRGHTDHMLALRGADVGTVAPNQLALFALAIIQDRTAIRRVLATPTRLETTDPQLLSLRAALAFLLLDDGADADLHDLIHRTLAALPENWSFRDLLLGSQAAIRAHNLDEAEQWEVAAKHFAKALTVENLTPPLRAVALNNLGICQHRLGREAAARQSLAAAVAAAPDAQNLARLNALTLAKTPDPQALAHLDDQCEGKDWGNLRAATRRWLIAAAQSAGDHGRAATLAKDATGPRDHPFRSRVAVLSQAGQVHWGVGLARHAGFQLRLQIGFEPWLIRKPPLSRAQVEAIAR